jgi:hypothetical protein
MAQKLRGIIFGAGVLTGVAAATYAFLLRPRHLRWGATQDEVDLQLPGDELVSRPKLRATHAVSIDAPPSNVWQWLVQIGQGRGGFYSYDWIENSLGLDVRNADKILPEFQDLNVGDLIPLAPGGFGIPVVILVPEGALVFHGDTRVGEPVAGMQMRPGDYLNVSWGFYLFDTGEGRTRLVERFLADWNPGFQSTLFYRLFLEPGSFLMERKMLLGIKERAERLQRSSGHVPVPDLSR